MKIVAIILNCILIAIALFLTADDWPIDIEMIPLIAVFFVCPLVNIFVICSYTANKPKRFSQTWLALYFKRKRLEE